MSNILVEKLRNGWHIFTHEDRIEAADAIALLQAENADLTAKCNHIMTEHGKLLAEVEGLRKDAARLDWLESNPGFHMGKFITWRNGEGEYDGVERGYWQITTNNDRELSGGSIRSAIDAAMQSNP